MASTARVMGPACVATRREPFVPPERVLNTMAEARGPSTRRLYALKWSIFSACCQDRDLDPVTSDVSVVVSFLQEMLDKQQSSSTIKVYPAAIAAFHAPIVGRSVGRDSAVITFLWGARRINPPHPRTVPPWDLPTVRKSEQLFVGFGNRAKGDPVTKQSISRWLVDAITLAYSSLGL